MLTLPVRSNLSGGVGCGAPAFDMDPTPTDVRARVLRLAIDETGDTAPLEVARFMARQCGLKPPAASDIVAQVQTAVAKWRVVAATHGLHARDVERMASAFEHGGTAA